jgi:hypothetical protein
MVVQNQAISFGAILRAAENRNASNVKRESCVGAQDGWLRFVQWIPANWKRLTSTALVPELFFRHSHPLTSRSHTRATATSLLVRTPIAASFVSGFIALFLVVLLIYHLVLGSRELCAAANLFTINENGCQKSAKGLVRKTNAQPYKLRVRYAINF